MKRSRQFLTLFLASILVAFSLAYVVNASISAPLEHFVFDDKLAGFMASNILCSFNASAESIVRFNLSSIGDGGYEVIYSIIGNNQGPVFNYSSYGNSTKILTSTQQYFLTKMILITLR